jgi:hypothetical protein
MPRNEPKERMAMTTLIGAGRTPAPPAPDPARRVIGLACRAPSVHNTQPWLWRIRPDHIELRADRRRQLAVADPEGRNLVISCGAALHHAMVAAAGLGWTSEATRFPVPEDPDLVAEIRLGSGRATPAAIDLLHALEDRRTDRRRFTSWPVPEERLAHLAGTDDDTGAHVLPVVDPADRFTTELLLERAISAQQRDESLAEEQRRWIDHSPVDGVPRASIPDGSRPHDGRSNRFAPVIESVDPRTVVEGSDGLLAICTADDTPLSWLHTGEALSRLWLKATIAGLSVVPLSQVIEHAESRAALHRQLFSGMALPQLLVRIGWQEISRRSLPRAPRRPLEDVLIT